MRKLVLVWLNTVLLSGIASGSSAQIITTMMPTQRVSNQQPGGGPPNGGSRSVTFHVMGGFTQWKFASVRSDEEFAQRVGGTLTGGERGFIGAADVAGRVSDNITVGGGGWINNVEDVVETYPDRELTFEYTGGDSEISPGFSATRTLRMYSVYANVFYKNFGAQAGIVPVQTGRAVFDSPSADSFDSSYTEDYSDTDTVYFGVGRFGSTRLEQRRWSAMFGAGLYRYGSEPALVIPEFDVEFPAVPSENAFSFFTNGSVSIHGNLSLDVSLWYTAKDDGQTRFTVGVGYGR